MKQIVRLTESDLHKLIKESVRTILKEANHGWDTNALQKEYDTAKDFEDISDRPYFSRDGEHHNLSDSPYYNNDDEDDWDWDDYHSNDWDESDVYDSEKDQMAKDWEANDKSIDPLEKEDQMHKMWYDRNFDQDNFEAIARLRHKENPQQTANDWRKRIKDAEIDTAWREHGEN